MHGEVKLFCILVGGNFINSARLAPRQVEKRGLDCLINERRTFDLLKAACLYKMNLLYTYLRFN